MAASPIHRINYDDNPSTARYLRSQGILNCSEKLGYNKFFGNAASFANDALKADRQGQEPRALTLYKKGIEYFIHAINIEDNKVNIHGMQREFNPVMDRAEELDKFMKLMKEAKLLGERAIDADNLRNWVLAKELYENAAENLIKSLKLVNKDSPTHSTLKERVTQFITRAEVLSQTQPLPLIPTAPPAPLEFNPYA